jgi:hypothetical protein
MCCSENGSATREAPGNSGSGGGEGAERPACLLRPGALLGGDSGSAIPFAGDRSCVESQESAPRVSGDSAQLTETDKEAGAEAEATVDGGRDDAERVLGARLHERRALGRGERLRTFNILDEGVQEALRIVVDTSIPCGRVVRTLEAEEGVRRIPGGHSARQQPRASILGPRGLVCRAWDQSSLHLAGRAEPEWAGRAVQSHVSDRDPGCQSLRCQRRSSLSPNRRFKMSPFRRI